MPTDLAVRLTYHDKNVTELVGQLNLFFVMMQDIEAMFIVCHNYLAYGSGVRQHVHMAIKGYQYTQDSFRRKFKKYYNRLHEEPLVSTDLSVKSWDGGDRYLIYMIKGQEESVHPILHNYIKDDWLNPWLSEERIQKLRESWREGVCPQAENYKMWMAHDTFPKKPVFNEYGETDVPKLSFDDVVKKATRFVCSINGEWITAKHRFAIKDLVSNYCMRHGIKMSPVYI